MLELFEQVEAMTIGPDDVLVIRSKSKLSDAQCDYLRSKLSRLRDVPILILDKGMSLKAMTKEELLAQLGEEPKASGATRSRTTGAGRTRRTAGPRPTKSVGRGKKKSGRKGK